MKEPKQEVLIFSQSHVSVSVWKGSRDKQTTADTSSCEVKGTVRQTFEEILLSNNEAIAFHVSRTPPLNPPFQGTNVVIYIP